MRDRRDDDLDPAPFMGAGWQRWIFPLIWLVYLSQTVHEVQRHSSGPAAVAGYAIVAAFAVVYALAGPSGWQGNVRRFWMLYSIGVALTVAELVFAHEGAFVFCVYLGVLTVASGARWAMAGIVFYSASVAFVPEVFGWRDSPDWVGGFTVLGVSLAMFGFFHIIQNNRELSAARAEVARLAAENERSRIARDLHDLLGHSLTTITVKAGLARRLAEHGDAERAFAEIAEVEQLSRRTLGDVRAAVTNQREVTLAGELATSREVLRAARVAAELPGSVDVVDPSLHELFGWVLREGVTNMVRHAHAPTCRVSLGERWIEISDTGNGAGGICEGNGLHGLQERLAAVGGTLTADSTFSGFRLRAEVPLPTGADERAAENAPPSDSAPSLAPSPVPSPGRSPAPAPSRALR